MDLDPSCLPAYRDTFTAWICRAGQNAGALIDFNCRRMTHEIAPCFGDLYLVAAGPQRSKQRLVKAVFQTERLGSVPPGTAIQPARIVDCGLHVVVEIDVTRHHCGTCLRLAFATHRAVH